MQQLFKSLLLTFFFVGCAVKQPTLKMHQESLSKLEHLLLELSPTVEPYEAKALAKESIDYSYLLSKKYEVIRFPWIQNSLVNIGLKKRGLCYHWTEDLLRFLVSKHYRSFTFHALGANIGKLNEHNALSVSAKNRGIEKSVLLDAWRNSGILYFKVLEEDKKYKWSERFNLYGILPPKKVVKLEKLNDDR